MKTTRVVVLGAVAVVVFDTGRTGERHRRIPIAVDNDRAIWRGFANHYWPALYFVDATGRVRDHHFGEGDSGESETTIRRMLAAAGKRSRRSIVRRVTVQPRGAEVAADWGQLAVALRPYVGRQKAANFASPGGAGAGHAHAPTPLPQSAAASISGRLSGRVDIRSERPPGAQRGRRAGSRAGSMRATST